MFGAVGATAPSTTSSAFPLWASRAWLACGPFFSFAGLSQAVGYAVAAPHVPRVGIWRHWEIKQGFT